MLVIAVLFFALIMYLVRGNSEVGIKLSGVAVLVALFTIALMVRQIRLAEKLEDIANRQTTILGRMDEAINAKAKLVVWGTLEWQSRPAGRSSKLMQTQIEFATKNIGTKTADGATLQLRIPRAFSNQAMFGWSGPSWYVIPEEDNDQYSRWEVDIDRLFFVGVPVKRATYLAYNHPDDMSDPFAFISWRIAFADGVTPGKSEWEPLTTLASLRDNFKDKPAGGSL